MWLFFSIWLAMTWMAFIKRETAIGIKVTMLEEKLRYPLIATLFIVAFMAFDGNGPIVTGEGSHWYPAKMALYAFALCIGPNAAEETALERENVQARISAYIYWITISGVCFLGAVKPF